VDGCEGVQIAKGGAQRNYFAYLVTSGLDEAQLLHDQPELRAELLDFLCPCDGESDDGSLRQRFAEALEASLLEVPGLRIRGDLIDLHGKSSVEVRGGSGVSVGLDGRQTNTVNVKVDISGSLAVTQAEVQQWYASANDLEEVNFSAGWRCTSPDRGHIPVVQKPSLTDVLPDSVQVSRVPEFPLKETSANKVPVVRKPLGLSMPPTGSKLSGILGHQKSERTGVDEASVSAVVQPNRTARSSPVDDSGAASVARVVRFSTASRSGGTSFPCDTNHCILMCTSATGCLMRQISGQP